jgi:hypothetical protein
MNEYEGVKCCEKDKCLNVNNYGYCFTQSEPCKFVLHTWTHRELIRLAKLEKLLQDEMQSNK